MGCKALVINRDRADGSNSHEIFMIQAYKRSFRTGDLSLAIRNEFFLGADPLALYKIEFKL